MKIKVYMKDDLENLIKTYNPLMLRNKDGKLEVFQYRMNCYYEFMRRFYQQHYKGYCEPVLWIHDTFGFELADCQRLFAIWRSKFRCPDEPFIIEWKNEKIANEYLKYFVKGCHIICGTTYDESDFILAFDLFCTNFERFEK